MKLLVIFKIALSLLFVVSCSTGPKKNKYHITNFTKDGLKLSFYKNTKKGLYGLKVTGKEEWVLKPKYKNINVRSKDNILVSKKGQKTYQKYSMTTKEFSKTDITMIFSPPYKASNKASGLQSLVVQKPGTVYAFKDNKSLEMVEIPNVDGHIKNEHGATLFPIYGGPWNGFFVRHNENGNKYYQAYFLNGQPMGKKYPLDRVVYMMNNSYSKGNIYQYIVPFEILDESKQLYWPILFVDNTAGKTNFIEKPSHIKGLMIDPVYHWSDMSLTPLDLLYIPAFDNAWFVYNDGGKEVLQNNEWVISKFKTFGDMRTFLTQNLDKSKKHYTDFELVPGKSITYNGGYFAKKYPTFKNQDGKYVYSYYSGKFSNENIYDTKKQMLDTIKMQSDNIKQIANLKKQKYIQNENENRQVRAENQRMTDEYFQKINDENAAASRAISERRRKDNSEVWGRVSKQLQQTGQDASKRAKCINKRTQTKKDFLAGKQGWYDTGGCK